MLNVLMAYPYLDPESIRLLDEGAERGDVRFLVDSGAFTAWKSGNPIQLDDYCRFLEGLPRAPWAYFMLDIIGDPEATARNYETMLARGFKPIPIFTRGDDPAVLDQYYNTTDVVAIGGLVGTTGNKGFVKGIMAHVGQRNVHWLGFCTPDYVNAFQPFSVDSSSWSYANRMGELKIWCGAGRMKSIFRRDMHTRPPQWILRVLRSYGVDPQELGQNDLWRSRSNRFMKVGARSWIRRSIETEAAIGTKVFLACASATDLSILLEQYAVEKEHQCSLARAASSSAPATAS